MRTTQNGHAFPVVWGRAPEGAGLLPGPHPWGSLDWTRTPRADGLGEREHRPGLDGKRPTVWFSGRRPAPYDGRDYCGTPHALRYGGYADGSEDFTTNAIGQAPGCATPPGPNVGWQLVENSGQRQGGSARQAGGYRLSMAGGQKQGASALQGGGYRLSALGGASQGGSAHVAGGALLAAAGGASQGGSAGLTSGAVLLAAGGAGSGGSAFQAGGYRLSAIGGASQGGSAHVAGGALLAAAGGASQGGSAGLTSGAVLLAAGGQAQGGSADQGGGYMQQADGGQAQGGSADQAGGYQQSAAGGQAQGGTATQSGSTPASPPPCSTSNAYVVTVTGVGGGGTCANANRAYAMAHTVGQNWSGAGGGWTAALNLTTTPYQLTFTAAGSSATYQAASFDCNSGGLFTRIATTGPCTGWPVTLVVT